MKPKAEKPQRVVKLFEPWVPPVLNLFDVASIQAVAKGIASEHQQKHAVRTIVEKMCGCYEDTFCPGVDGDRLSAYAQGKRRVGLMLVSYINAPLKNFKDPDAAPTEQG